ncbi:hypothetical protein COLU111180_09925 [Cohnella lubricantis]|uniref:Lipoprotein n=1 Tax=Cohnella lubricantis TaxID=2163172 RepID=A0A841TIQ2_9BACL|nr:hypothetical protein [Cohnella lubricantis]MBB6678371.1 hypothetical protein [Cohnella lubricantis]MBP2116751.1 hypothetical protein [Cohnella lubricantis]
MKISYKNLLILAAAALALTACSNEKTAGTNGGKPPAAASASASPSATVEASASAAPEAAQYTIDVPAASFERAPEGTSLEPVSEDSAIYIPSDSNDAKVHLALNLNQKGDFTVAEGSGTLTIGGSSVPFKINQVSVMHRDTLSTGQTLFYGGLQVDTQTQPSTFAFGFRFIAETQDLQLRLSNGEGLVVFGGGGAIAKNEAEIENFEADHRPKN